MASTLSLGDIEFKDFEIPERLKGLGGTQTLSVFNYVGPKKGVQALGPKPGEPSWEGTFLYEEALDRANAVDAYRKSGEVVRFSWASLAYNVIVREFIFNVHHEYEIDYSIRLEVIDELSNGPRQRPTATPDSSVSDGFAICDALLPNLESNSNFASVPLPSGLSLPEDPVTTLAYLTEGVVLS